MEEEIDLGGGGRGGSERAVGEGWRGKEGVEDRGCKNADKL